MPLSQSAGLDRSRGQNKCRKIRDKEDDDPCIWALLEMGLFCPPRCAKMKQIEKIMRIKAWSPIKHLVTTDICSTMSAFRYVTTSNVCGFSRTTFNRFMKIARPAVNVVAARIRSSKGAILKQAKAHLGRTLFGEGLRKWKRR